MQLLSPFLFPFIILSQTTAFHPNFIITNVANNSANEPILIAQQSRTIRLRFAPGKSSAVVENAVIRGTRDTYLIGAKKDQTMTISMTSVENNAAFDVLAPDGSTIKEGVTSFSGKLPSTGDYRIVIGGTRGNATYKMQVSIK